MNNPLVTVVIPVYNVERYINQCLNSVLKQTYQNIEIIIVDDATPDSSIEKISPIRDPRIRIISQQNRGLAGARNTGIRESDGKYIAFLDSDDFWHPDKLSQHVNALESNAQLGVSFSASRFVDESGNNTNRLQQPLVKHSFTPAQIFCRNPIGNGSAPVIRKSILNAITFHTPDKEHTQYFNEALRQSEDIECWVRIAVITQCQFNYVDQPLTYYRLNAGGLSANVDKQLASWEFFVEQLTAYAPSFAAKNVRLARAYQYRYLARRLILEGNTLKATRLMLMAIRSHVGIFWREPGRSSATLIASLALSVLPKKSRMSLIHCFI